MKNLIKILGLTIVLGMSLNASIFESAAYEIDKTKIVHLEKNLISKKDFTENRSKRLITNDLASDKYNEIVIEYNQKLDKELKIVACIVMYRKIIEAEKEEKNTSYIREYFKEECLEKEEIYSNDKSVLFAPSYSLMKEINNRKIIDKSDKRNWSYPIKKLD